MACDAAVQPVLDVEDFAVRRAGGFAARVPRLRLLPGEVAALYGPSGSGKTTLLHAMFGIDTRGLAVSGRVEACGGDFLRLPASERRRMLRLHMAWIMQDAPPALDPLQPIGLQLEQATYRRRDDCIAALRELGLEDAAQLSQRLPHQISGGQAQRVLLAVAWLRQPELLIADEPSASLDDGNFDELVARLRRLRDRGAAILMSTHDHRLLTLLGAQVLVARDGGFEPGRADELPWPQRPVDDLCGALPVVAAKDVSVRFGTRTVLDAVSLALCRGEITALIGESGAGKTTLGRVIAGHLVPQHGTVERPLRRHAVQLLFQDALAALTPGRTLRGLLQEAQAPFFDGERAAQQLGLPMAVLDRPAEAMSGGERRRAALLRALAVHPDVLVLDEPTASLDRAAAVAVLESLLAMRRERGLALLLITHDRSLAAAVAHRVVELKGGKACQLPSS